MMQLNGIIVVVLVSAVCCLPVEKPENYEALQEGHGVQKRFINPLFSLGAVDKEDLFKIRTKRSEFEDECEKLRLCKLHARAGTNFFAAFQLYFVNKDNARQWDHQSRSAAQCYRTYGDCFTR